MTVGVAQTSIVVSQPRTPTGKDGADIGRDTEVKG